MPRQRPSDISCRRTRQTTLRHQLAIGAEFYNESIGATRKVIQTSGRAVVMALCRAFVYLVAAVAVTTSLTPRVLWASALLAGYVIVLSQIAKRDLVSGRYIAMLIAVSRSSMR